jgi:hypothetical protein
MLIQDTQNTMHGYEGKDKAASDAQHLFTLACAYANAEPATPAPTMTRSQTCFERIAWKISSCGWKITVQVYLWISVERVRGWN